MDIESIKTTRFSDIDVPNKVKGKVVAVRKKNRFITKDMAFVQLELEGSPTIALSSTIAMNVSNLEQGKDYTFRRYNLYYTREKTGKVMHSFSYDRGDNFSVVGKAGKTRFYEAR